MKKVLQRRPSASMVVAVLALVMGASGTAVAAGSLVSGDKLIKKHSLSGNRLKNHTITGTQIKMSKLGTVPKAKDANYATSAGSASSATNAANATNASTVGGDSPSAFEKASNWTRSGLVKASAGQTVPLVSFGPFALSIQCVSSGSNIQVQLYATSTEANSDGYGTLMPTAGQSYKISGIYPPSSTSFYENDDNSADFFTPSGKTYIADLTWGENWSGVAACYANALVSPS